MGVPKRGIVWGVLAAMIAATIGLIWSGPWAGAETVDPAVLAVDGAVGMSVVESEPTSMRVAIPDEEDHASVDPETLAKVGRVLAERRDLARRALDRYLSQPSAEQEILEQLQKEIRVREADLMCEAMAADQWWLVRAGASLPPDVVVSIHWADITGVRPTKIVVWRERGGDAWLARLETELEQRKKVKKFNEFGPATRRDLLERRAAALVDPRPGAQGWLTLYFPPVVSIDPATDTLR